jgi:hypothetical protein
MGAKDVQITISGKDQTGGLFSKLRQESMCNLFPGSAQIAAGIVGEDGAVPRLSTAILITKIRIEGDGTAAVAGGAQRYSRHSFAKAVQGVF